MQNAETYRGRCHCGAVTFTLRCPPITDGCRCNCSICIRKGALMSSRYFTPEEITVVGVEKLRNYHFGDLTMNHYFCPTCGVFPFADPIAKPGYYRVNLGCLDDFDPLSLPVRLIDGRSF